MTQFKLAINLLFTIILLTSCNNSDKSNNSQISNDQETQTPDDSAIKKKQNIIFFGNSLTAGLGLVDKNRAFPAIIGRKIDSLGLQYNCINAGLSGETSAGGLERVDWILREPIDIFVLELGANDGLRGISTESTYTNLKAICEKVKSKNPNCKIVLAGMKIPPNMGKEYFQKFEQIYPKLAGELEITLIPFLLDGVAGDPNLNQSDAIHPTSKGQEIVAGTVWQYLEPLLDD